MKKLYLASLPALVLALFSPLLILPRETAAAPAPASPPPSAQVVYAGTDSGAVLRLLGPEGVVETDMETYLLGAVAAEMPALFHQEALRAQAVALRTYALRAMEYVNPRHPEADVCADPSCCAGWLDEAALREKWGADYDVHFAKIASAVRATDGQYLSYEGQAVQAVFHAASAGRTAGSGELWAEAPYLVSVVSPETAETVQNLVTQVELTPAEVLARLPAWSPDAAPVGEMRRTASGRVERVELYGQTLTGQEARQLFGLRSADFDAAFDGARIVFTVRGYGHGVGMSQQGANLLAREGWDCAAILAHYYPGTELVGA